MDYRNSSHGIHIGGAVVAGVEYGSGIELNPNSSGSAPTISPVGDETNKGITIVGKGTGTITVGNSSNPIAIAGPQTASAGLKVGSSGSSMSEILKAVVQFTPPTLSTGAASVAESTHTVAGASTGAVIFFTPTNPISAQYTLRAHCSTVNELKLVWGNHGKSTLGTGESTNRGVMLQFRF